MEVLFDNWLVILEVIIICFVVSVFSYRKGYTNAIEKIIDVNSPSKEFLKLASDLLGDFYISKEVHDFLPSIIDAERIVTELEDMIKRYGYVTVDYYKILIGVPPTLKDQNYGWLDVGMAHIDRGVGGYYVKLPPEKNIQADILTIETIKRKYNPNFQEKNNDVSL